MRFVTGSLAASRGRPGRLLPPARCPAPARRRPSLAGSRLLAAKDGLTAFSRVLHSDYRGTGVSATSLILGPVKDTGVSARTLAETGLTASTAFSVSPQKVAAAILRAIDTPKPEMVISVGPGRALKALMDYFPALGPALNRLSGADKLMTAVADHREAARTNPAQRNNAQPT